MKKLKASKDLFAIFYIVNWILSIIIAPLGGYAVIVLMLSTIEFLSSGKTSILMQFMMFSMIFKSVYLSDFEPSFADSEYKDKQGLASSGSNQFNSDSVASAISIHLCFERYANHRTLSLVDRGCATMLDFVFPQLSLRSVWTQRTKKEGTALGRAYG